MIHHKLVKILLGTIFTLEFLFAQNILSIVEIDSLNELSYNFRKKHPEQTVKIAQDVINNLAGKQYQNGISTAYKNIGLGYYYLGKLDSAIINEFSALKSFELNWDSSNVAGSFNRLGLYYRKNKDYKKAIENYNKALVLFRELNDIRNESKTLNNLAVTNSILENNDIALKYYDESLQLKEKINDVKGICKLYNNIANIYYQQKEFDRALDAHGKSLKLKKTIRDTLGIIVSLSNIATLNARQSKNAKAINNYIEALELAGSIKDDIHKLAIYNNLSTTYEKLKDYENTFKYYHLHTQLKDSLYSLAKDKQIAEIREEYETEKKDQKISKQQLEIEKGETEKILLISFSGFVIIIMVLIAISYYQKKKANKILNKQKDDISRINQELNSVNNTKDKLFSIIAHDIRSPIISLQNMTDLMDQYRSTGEDEQYFKTVPEINRSVKHLNLMMENLFNWSITQRGRLKTNKTEFDFYGLILSCIELQKISADVKDITISVNDFDEEYIFADINMMRSVLNNLISNAIKFTPISGNIDLVLEKNQNELILKIKDSGCGIEEDNIKTLFNLDEKKIKSGTKGERGVGLGLVMTKEFLKNNNGSVFIESTINVGTTFTVKLKKEEVNNLELV